MVHTRNIGEEVAEELAAVAEQNGCELIHAEFQAGILRLFIDHPDGVTLDDCQTVSKEVSAVLDVLDFGKGRYTLEVSSPGLDRELYGPRDYERFLGRLVRVTHRDRETGRKRTDVGRLEAFRPDAPGGGEITVVEPTEGRRVEVSLGDVHKTRLEIEL